MIPLFLHSLALPFNPQTKMNCLAGEAFQAILQEHVKCDLTRIDFHFQFQENPA